MVDTAVRGVIRILYTKAIRSGRVLYRRVYSDQVAQLVLAIKAVHLEPKNSTSLGALITPFKVIELTDTLYEDAQL